MHFICQCVFHTTILSKCHFFLDTIYFIEVAAEEGEADVAVEEEAAVVE